MRVPLPPSDARWLARAVALAELARGRSSPNPAVGCVLVCGAAAVGEGTTGPPGGPHAEIVALHQAGSLARDATAYTTLEPCAHHGRTPPCTDALIRAGVQRVVIGHADPHPQARGGQQVLRTAGVLVDGPLAAGDPFAEAIAGQLEGFLTAIRHRRPHLTLKVAQTIDGSWTAPRGQRWITGVQARRAVHRWRASVDGVLVGSGTVLADDPELTVRHVPALRQPRPVIVDGSARTPASAVVARSGAILVTTDAADGQRLGLLRAQGVSIETVPRGRDRGIDLDQALGRLLLHGLTSILAEPGPTLAQALLDADLVDRLVVHVGSAGPGTVASPAVRVESSRSWKLERFGGAGPDAIIQHVRARAIDHR